jgi:hypothetical protein
MTIREYFASSRPQVAFIATATTGHTLIVGGQTAFHVSVAAEATTPPVAVLSFAEGYAIASRSRQPRSRRGADVLVTTSGRPWGRRGRRRRARRPLPFHD